MSPKRPFAVTAQDTVRIDFLRITVDEPIVGFQLVPVSSETLGV